jgi:hypothetical protein
VLMFSEFNQAPLFDFSPSYVVTGKPVRVLEVGAGISFHRWIPIEPGRTTPRGPNNTYVEIDNFPAYGVADLSDPTNPVYPQISSGGKLRDFKNRIPNFVDSAGNTVVTVSTDAAGNTIYIRNDNNDTLRISKVQRLTFKAIKLMGRASLDLGLLTGLPQSSGPFKLFGEVAVLGVENQPYYYENRSERIPVMLGASIPTFGILDLLNFQVEYLKNNYPDNNSQQYVNSIPHPAYPGDSPAEYAARKAAGQYQDDDLKWSVFLKKTLVPGLETYLQVANDHFRVQDYNAQPSYMPLTQRPSDWYYMLRFQWNI